MAFPDTRLTLIHRIVDQRSEEDWAQFLRDYWNPLCRFAARRAQLNDDEAEDVASQTFEALLQNDLLSRWRNSRSAKLRTLLCTVVRNILSNRARVAEGRRKLLARHAETYVVDGPLPAHGEAQVSQEQEDAFYSAWAESLLEQTVEMLVARLHSQGKGDYVRVIYGRLCEGMTIPEISKALRLKTATAENYYKSARRQLADELEHRVREHVVRYSEGAGDDDEFSAEWSRLGEFLHRHGGLEQAVRASYSSHQAELGRRRGPAFATTLRLLAQD